MSQTKYKNKYEIVELSQYSTKDWYLRGQALTIFKEALKE